MSRREPSLEFTIRVCSFNINVQCSSWRIGARTARILAIVLESLQATNSTLNSVAGNQLNIIYNTVIHPPQPHYVPPPRFNSAPIDLLSASFTGRQRELEFLFQVFSAQENPTEEDVPTRCAVHGMPGVGKTKLVLRFAQIVFAQLLYSHIFWMSGASIDKLIEGMTKILDIVGHPERMRSEHSAKLTAARLWLEDSRQSEAIRWLLILDNVDGSVLEFLCEHLPQRNAKGSILFTTRAVDVADALVPVTGNRHSTLKLRVPDLVDTTHLFFKCAGIDASTMTPTQKEQAKELTQNLGCLPLAVVQAASYVKQTGVTLDSALQISQSERRIEMIEWKSDLATDQQRSVIITFNTLLDQLERDSPEAYDVLRVLSFLDPEDIPLTMLTDGARMSLDDPLPGNSQHGSSMISRIAEWTHIRRSSRHHSENDASNPAHPSPELRSLVSVILSPTAFPKALHKLQSISLVEPLSRDGESSLRMHDLVHTITLEHVKRRMAYQAWLESGVSLVWSVLRRVGDPYLPQSWPECEKIMPHVRSLSKVWTGVEGVNLPLAKADVRLAKYLNSRGRYDDAERLCERSVGIFRKELGEKHTDTLSAFYLLSQVYGDKGRFTDAEEVLKHVLALRKKELGGDHRITLATMNELAAVYRRQCRYKEAEELFKRVLAVDKKKLGPDHPTTLTMMNNLASIYYSQERYDEAEELNQHVLACKEKALGPDHLSTLFTVNNLADIYRLRRKYSDAETLYERALVGKEKQLGPNHPYTLLTVMNLALLYESQARNDEAERFYFRAFTGMKEHLGANHPDTLQSAKSFAEFYRSLGRNVEADALLGQ